MDPILERKLAKLIVYGWCGNAREGLRQYYEALTLDQKWEHTLHPGPVGAWFRRNFGPPA